MRNWIFDLDGTLTKPVHDFDELCRRLELESGTPILEAIAKAAPEQARLMSRIVADWEWEAARKAEAADGAHELLHALDPSTLAILTRNRRDIALETLKAIGFLDLFAPELILGRDEAEPKPSPRVSSVFCLTLAGWPTRRL